MLVEGPIGAHDSLPYGTATQEGSEAQRLLKQFDYVEEEFFFSGTANVYGPLSFEAIEPGQPFFITRRPLSTVHQRNVPYKTRALVIRPRDVSRFSGVVHAVPVHVLAPTAAVEPNLLRIGAAWIGVEVNDGARYGTEAIPSGGVAHLRRSNPDRYRDLSVTGGNPNDWGLPDPVVAKAWENMQIQEDSPEQSILSQEMFRTLAQGPDIFLDLVKGLKLGHQTCLPGFEVRRVYTSGASGSSLIPNSLVNDGHHDRNMLDDGRPPIDGYLIYVGFMARTVNRPRDAVLVGFESELEVLHWRAGRHALEGPPENTDDPRFRYYELPGAGHVFSVPRGDVNYAARDFANVLPPGLKGLTQSDSTAEYERYNKFNAPIMWALWAAMYHWVEEGIPMPRAEPITRDRNAPDGIARDEHGNALGGLRTPWVDVPDATYVAKLSADDPNYAGMRRFSDEKMLSLYGSRVGYERRVQAKLGEMVQQGFLLDEDRDLMFAQTSSP
jgi:hypothetical protein